MPDPIQCLVISDFNVSNFCGYLNNDSALPEARATPGPYGQVIELLMDAAHSCWRDSHDVVVVWTTPEAAVPSFRDVLEFRLTDAGRLLADVDLYTKHLLSLQGRTSTIFVPTWVLSPQYRGLGMLDLKHAAGAAGALLLMNARLSEGLRDAPAFYALDAQRWITSIGPKAFSPQLWYMGKTPFGPGVFKEAATDLKAALAALKGMSRKLLLVDLDETLWGGIVGETGWQQLTLGGHDPIGEALVDFQRAVRALKNRGILLGIVSRNEETVALDAIRHHPEMVLRLEDFAGWKINWKDKAENIVELVEELNVGLQSVVYIDDDPGQRQRIRGALPEVLVPDWPADKMLYREALGHLRCFDLPTISGEDRVRADMYVVERRRKDLARTFQSVDEWLRNLEIRIRAAPLDEGNLPRAAQLFNKTNQMNLSTRRMTESELWKWSQAANHRVWTFRVQDRFGDCGLVGLASLAWDRHRGEIVDFVLSCRAFGRRVEETMIHVLAVDARTAGLTRIDARYLPTAKNRPCLDFFVGASGFQHDADEVFTWDLARDYPSPPTVELS